MRGGVISGSGRSSGVTHLNGGIPTEKVQWAHPPLTTMPPLVVHNYQLSEHPQATVEPPSLVNWK